MSLPPAIGIDAVEQIYPTGTRALMPVSLDIAPGEFVTLLGPSGCGKSTLLNMVAGLLQPTQGRISVQGHAAGSPAARQGLSFVFQEPTLMPWASVARNVRLPLDLAGVPAAQADARAQEALAGVGLAHFSQRHPHELSGGMQMRASIARGLVTQPQLLLMDEPFGALDEITRNRLDADLLALWRAKSLTVLFVTHSITEAVFLSSRVIVMGAHPGRILQELRLDTPWPRPPNFRASATFVAHVAALHEALAAGSADLPQPEGPA